MLPFSAEPALGKTVSLLQKEEFETVTSNSPKQAKQAGIAQLPAIVIPSVRNGCGWLGDGQTEGTAAHQGLGAQSRREEPRQRPRKGCSSGEPAVSAPALQQSVTQGG